MLESTRMTIFYFSGRPGLVVMGDNSCSKGRGFESQWYCHTGWTFLTFFTLICCKNCIVCLKRPKMNEKEAGVGPFLKRVPKELWSTFAALLAWVQCYHMGEKVVQSPQIVAQKAATAVFSTKLMLSQIAQKSYNIWATFVRMIFARSFEKSPNLATLFST